MMLTNTLHHWIALTTVALFALFPAKTLALGFTTPIKAKYRVRQATTELRMGWFDFTPVHGSGSGKDDLEEQWEAQQAILRARRDGNLDKAHLRQKYKDSKESQLNKMIREHEHKNTESNRDNMFVEDKPSSHRDKPKFFWEK